MVATLDKPARMNGLAKGQNTKAAPSRGALTEERTMASATSDPRTEKDLKARAEADSADAPAFWIEDLQAFVARQ